MKETRSFEGTRKGAAFTIETKLTDDEAIKAIGGFDGSGFKPDCAFEIHRMAAGGNFKSHLVAWGFRMAEEALNPKVEITLSKKLRDLVRFRKPYSWITKEGEVIHIRLSGPNSRHAGKYALTNGMPFRDSSQKFYGFATPKGKWTPTHVTPEAVVAAVKKGPGT